MDSLALLCNLYGDGPQTLRRLREAGCTTLAALDSIESERLATLLRTSVRAASRFQSEGRLLRERSELPLERSRRRKSGDGPGSQADAAARPLLTPVLDAWRERDARSGPDSDVLGKLPMVARAARSVGGARADGPPLEGLEGMDAELIASLRGAGIDSLRDLCGADVLDLAGRGVAGYTRLLRVQFLARRRLESDVERGKATAVVTLRAGGDPAPSLAAAPCPSVIGERGTGSEGRAAGDETRRREPETSSGTAASTPLLETDEVIPHPPPDRRRADRSLTATRPGVIERFSPSSDSISPAEPRLQSELERYAREQASAPEGSTTIGACEEEGSSGPFA